MPAEVRLPMFPECWETCGNCAQGEVVVGEVLVKPGDVLRADDYLIILETGKVALEVPSPYAGRIVDVCVDLGERLEAGQLICTIEV